MFALLAVSACGGGGDPVSPLEPPPVVIPLVKVVSVTITGQTSVVVGITFPFRAVARFSDGSEKDVTMESSWSALDSGVKLTFGAFTAYAPGSVVVKVRYQEMVGVINLQVSYPTPVSWSSLPFLSEEGKAWIRAYNLNSLGAVSRWQDTVRIWAQPGFSRPAVDSAVAFWRTVLEDRLVLVVVPDSTGHKQISITFSEFIGDPLNPCGRGGAQEVSELFAIIQGTAKVRAGACNTANVIAHEVGHALGLNGHTTTGDIMGITAPNLVSSPFLTELLRWITTVPVGTFISG